jgi:hypothetical protein
MLFYFDLQQFGFCSATKLIQMLQITPPEMLILDNYQLNDVKQWNCVCRRGRPRQGEALLMM